MTRALLIAAALGTVTGCIPWDEERAAYCADAGSGCREDEIPNGTISLLSGGNQSRAVWDAFGPIVVEARNPDGTPAQSLTLSFSVPLTEPTGYFGGSDSSATAVTGADGRVEVPFIYAGNLPGGYEMTVGAPRFTELRIPLSQVLGPPFSIELVSGDSQTAPVDSAFGSVLTVKITDAGRNPLQGATVTFTAPASGATATFANGTTVTSATTDAAGLASSTVLTAGTVAGPLSVAVTVDSLNNAFSGLSVSPGAVTQVVVLDGSDQTTLAGEPVPQPLRVRSIDTHGNPVPGNAITFMNGVSGAHCLFDGAGFTVVASDDSGISATNCVTALGEAGDFSVSLEDPTLGALGPQFSLHALVADYLMAPDTAVQSPDASGVYPVPLTLKVYDVNGTAIPNARVQFVAPDTGAPSVNFYLGGGTTVEVLTDATGEASSGQFYRVNGIGQGQVSIVASVVGYPGVAPVTFTVNN